MLDYIPRNTADFYFSCNRSASASVIPSFLIHFNKNNNPILSSTTTKMRLYSLALIAPFLPTLALAKPHALAMALAEPVLLPPTSNTCPCYPDNADSEYKGYLGSFRAIGFPYRIGCPAQSAQISEARIEDTVRRALGAPPVQPPQDLGACAGTTFPIYQGTVYIGSIQIFVAWDAAAKVAHYCRVSDPQEDCVATFATPLCDRPAKG